MICWIKISHQIIHLKIMNILMSVGLIIDVMVRLLFCFIRNSKNELPLNILNKDNQLIVEKHTESKAGENEHKNQSYYNEEEVKIIAQKIERNLTFEKTNKKKNGSDKSSNNSSISESNRRDSAAQADLVIDETATSNNDGEVEG